MPIKWLVHKRPRPTVSILEEKKIIKKMDNDGPSACHSPGQTSSTKSCLNLAWLKKLLQRKQDEGAVSTHWAAQEVLGLWAYCSVEHPPPPLLPSVPSFQIYKAPFLLICKKNFLKLIREGLLPNTSYLKHRFPNGLFIGLHSSLNNC